MHAMIPCSDTWLVYWNWLVGLVCAHRDAYGLPVDLVPQSDEYILDEVAQAGNRVWQGEGGLPIPASSSAVWHSSSRPFGTARLCNLDKYCSAPMHVPHALQ